MPFHSGVLGIRVLGTMDIHTPGLPSGFDIGNTYPQRYPQRPFMLPEAKMVTEAMGWVDMLGIPREKIPAFCQMAYELRENPDAEQNPAEAMRRMAGWDNLKARRAGPANDFVLDRLLRRIWIIDPLNLAMAYWSKIQHGSNAVMERSYIFPCVGACTMNRETVLVDPSPNLLELYAAQARARGTKYTLYVSDTSLLHLYSISDQIRQSFDMRYSGEMTPMPDGVHVLYCSPYSPKSNVGAILARIASALRHCRDYTYQILMPNVWFDRGLDSRCIRQMLYDAHHIDRITIISEDLCKAPPKKQLLIDLSPKSSELAYPIITQRLVGDLSKKRAPFEAILQVVISTTRLIPAVRSIIDLHRAAVQTTSDRNEEERHRAQEYYAIADIPFWFTISDYKKSDTKDRIKVMVYELLESNVDPDKLIHRGECVYSRNERVVPKDQHEKHMEHVLLHDSEARQHIRSILEKTLNIRSLSVKAVWALYVHGDSDIIKTYKRYDDRLCQVIFGDINAAFAMLNGMPVASATSSMVDDAVDDYMIRTNTPTSRQLSILGQIQIVFEVAKNLGLYSGENPVDALMSQERKQRRKRYEGRQNGGRKGLTEAQLQMLFDDLDSDTEHEGLRLATQLRLTGISPDEICALRCGDYKKDKLLHIHYLDIHTHIVGSSYEVYLWSDSDKIRRLGLPTRLDRKIEDYAARRHKALKQRGFSLSEIHKLPLFAGALDQIDHIIPRVLRTYGKRFIDGLDMLPMLPQSEHRRKRTDYSGDWYASTFKETARNEGLMSDDEIAHCMGNKRVTTYGKHYCDYDDRYSLVIQKAGLDNIFRLIYVQSEIDTLTKQGATGFGGVRVPVPQCKDRSQVVVRMTLPCAGFLIIRSGETGHLMVDPL